MFKPTGGTELKLKNRPQTNLVKPKINEKNVVFTAIEFDSMGLDQFPAPGDAPINIFCLLEPSNKTCHVYILRNKNNLLIQKFEDNKKEFINGLCELKHFKEYVYHIDFVDTEKELIEQYWMLQRRLTPDVSLSWGGLDVEYPALIKRMERLNIDKAIACDPKFGRTILEIVEDTNHQYLDHYDKKIFLSCMSNTQYRDQLKDYVNSHRTVQPPQTFMLHHVVEHETNFKYQKNNIEIVDIRTFPYEHFNEFVFGVIETTVTQYELEKTIQKKNLFSL